MKIQYLMLIATSLFSLTYGGETQAMGNEEYYTGVHNRKSKDSCGPTQSQINQRKKQLTTAITNSMRDNEGIAVLPKISPELTIDNWYYEEEIDVLGNVLESLKVNRLILFNTYLFDFPHRPTKKLAKALASLSSLKELIVTPSITDFWDLEGDHALSFGSFIQEVGKNKDITRIIIFGMMDAMRAEGFTENVQSEDFPSNVELWVEDDICEEDFGFRSDNPLKKFLEGVKKKIKIQTISEGSLSLLPAPSTSVNSNSSASQSNSSSSSSYSVSSVVSSSTSLLQLEQEKEQIRLATLKKEEEQKRLEEAQKEQERLAALEKEKEQERLAVLKKEEEQRLLKEQQKLKEEQERLAALEKEQERLDAEKKQQEEQERQKIALQKEQERLRLEEEQRREQERLEAEQKLKEQERLEKEAREKEEQERRLKDAEEERLRLEAEQKAEETRQRLDAEKKQQEEQERQKIALQKEQERLRRECSTNCVNG